jgi:hypothetical protein
MNILRGAVVIALLLAIAVGLPAQSRTFPVDEIKPGMVGIGRTVFEGDRLEEFKVNIIGVLRNSIGPRRNLILAKLEGGPLANTGVIAGMSGSRSTSTDVSSVRCRTRWGNSPRNRSRASRRSTR